MNCLKKKIKLLRKCEKMLEGKNEILGKTCLPITRDRYEELVDKEAFLELLLNKNVSVLRVKVCDNAKEYNENIFLTNLTQEEYDKIKARLKK